MNKGLVILIVVLALVIAFALFSEGGPVAIFCAFLGGAIAVQSIRLGVSEVETHSFLVNLFIGALLVRVLLASVIVGFELQLSFGPDAIQYDFIGSDLANYWWGAASVVPTDYLKSGWGMPYFVGAVYFLLGQTPLAAQLIICVFGAASSVLAFLCAKEIFNNSRVARHSGLFVAFFPAMIVWTCQMLKEGLIIFLLVLALLAALHLQKKFSYAWVFYLLAALLAIFSLRFYIFFMVLAAVMGSFILGVKTSAANLVSRFVVCSLIGVAFSTLGVWDISEKQADKHVTLERIQVSRSYAAEAANSGLEEDVDVSTTSGLIAALPMGLLTLFLAPFPWQVRSATQALTMPEMIVWWLSLPFLFSGIFYTIKHRFRESASILFFTLILSLSYAVYQGNLGTLYRQRAQIQVFLLIFTSVGFTIWQERRENASLRARKRPVPQGLPSLK